MFHDITKYLLSITNEETTSNILRALANLNEIYNDSTIEIGLLNWLAQVQETDGYSAKSELLSLILKWQEDILLKSGIRLNTIDYYSIDKLDAIIEMLTSLENYEDKYSLLSIINNADDNKFVIANLTEEITKRHDSYSYLELLNEVNDSTIDLLTDYCQTTTDDVINTFTPDLERHQKLKDLIAQDPEGYNVIKDYILNGFDYSISLKNILSIVEEDLIELSVPEIIRNVKAAFLISLSTIEDATADVQNWANETFVNRPDAVIELSNINFGDL